MKEGGFIMNKTVFGVMTIIFNCLGVPDFIAGSVKTGILKIVFAAITFGIIEIINFVKGIFQGIKILKMTDEEFAAADLKTLVVGIPAIK